MDRVLITKTELIRLRNVEEEFRSFRERTEALDTTRWHLRLGLDALLDGKTEIAIRRIRAAEMLLR